LSISADGTILAVGPGNFAGNADSSGEVRVFQLDNTSNNWAQMGGEVIGAAGNEFGSALSLSSDGLTFAAVTDSFTDTSTHTIGVFRFNAINQTWTQLGDNVIEAEESAYTIPSRPLSISGNGETLVVGARGTGAAGSVSVYTLTTSNQWEQLGNIVEGTAPGDELGYSVWLSADAQTMALGAQQFENGGTGYVRTFRFSTASSDWVQTGTGTSALLMGTTADDKFGSSLSLSMNGEKLAVIGPGLSVFSINPQCFDDQFPTEAPTLAPLASVTPPPVLSATSTPTQASILLQSSHPSPAPEPGPTPRPVTIAMSPTGTPTLVPTLAPVPVPVFPIAISPTSPSPPTAPPEPDMPMGTPTTLVVPTLAPTPASDPTPPTAPFFPVSASIAPAPVADPVAVPTPTALPVAVPNSTPAPIPTTTPAPATINSPDHLQFDFQGVQIEFRGAVELTPTERGIFEQVYKEWYEAYFNGEFGRDDVVVTGMETSVRVLEQSPITDGGFTTIKFFQRITYIDPSNGAYPSEELIADPFENFSAREKLGERLKNEIEAFQGAERIHRQNLVVVPEGSENLLSSNEALPTGAVAGIVVGAVVGIIVVAGLAYYVKKRKQDGFQDMKSFPTVNNEESRQSEPSIVPSAETVFAEVEPEPEPEPVIAVAVLQDQAPGPRFKDQSNSVAAGPVTNYGGLIQVPAGQVQSPPQQSEFQSQRDAYLPDFKDQVRSAVIRVPAEPVTTTRESPNPVTASGSSGPPPSDPFCGSPSPVANPSGNGSSGPFISKPFDPLHHSEEDKQDDDELAFDVNWETF